MKNLIRSILIFLFLFTSVKAATFDVLVLPSDLLLQKENYYGFDEVSVIIANDIIKDFNNSKGKMQSPDLYEVRAKLNSSPQLKQSTAAALNKFRNGNIDYAAFKTIGDNFSCKSVLLVSSAVTTNKSSSKRNVWEVLEISTEFDINYPYRLETPVVLLDTVNNLVMWSNNYSTKLGTNENEFFAKSFVQANEQYEKIKLYSKDIVAPSAVQNIMLRFFPKVIRPVNAEIQENSGEALRYERNLPETPRQHELRPKNDFYGDMIFGI